MAIKERISRMKGGLTFRAGDDFVQWGVHPVSLFGMAPRARPASIGDSLRNAPTEQQPLLGHQGHLTSELAEPAVAAVLTFDQQVPGKLFIHTKQQRDGCRFAGAARADERDPLSRSCWEVDRMKNFDLLS